MRAPWGRECVIARGQRCSEQPGRGWAQPYAHGGCDTRGAEPSWRREPGSGVYRGLRHPGRGPGRAVPDKKIMLFSPSDDLVILPAPGGLQSAASQTHWPHPHRTGAYDIDVFSRSYVYMMVVRHRSHEEIFHPWLRRVSDPYRGMKMV